MSEPREPSADSQNGMVLAYLRRGYGLTPLDALRMFGTQRLAARIQDLEEMGWTFTSEMVEENGKRFARYTLRVTDAQLEEAGQMALFK